MSLCGLLKRFFLAILSMLLLLSALPVTASQQHAPTDIPSKMTVTEGVLLALRNNLDLRSSFLDRQVQRINLKVAEYKFKPHTTLSWEARVTSPYDDVSNKRYTGDKHGGGVDVSLTIPTGGKFNFTWDNSADRRDFDNAYTYSSAWNLTFNQPILKGGGTDVNIASVKIARINEDQNILSLKNNIMVLITSTVQAYRSYAQAIHNLVINKRSLEMSERLYQINKALIEAGRMAFVELVQSEADIANRKIGILQAETSIEASRLALIQILNIDKDTKISIVDEIEKKVFLPSVKEALNIAFANRPDYLQSLMNVEKAKLNLAVAKRDRLWSLNFVGGIKRGASNSNFGSALRSSGTIGKSDMNLGLELAIPIDDPTIEQGYVNAKVGLKQAELSLQKLKLNIEVEVANALRDAEIRYRQYELAKLSVTLSRRKLETEKEKLKVGRSTNFLIISFQDALVSAELAELAAMIDYLNILTRLDQTLGTTLASWNISVKKDDDEVKINE